jgi:hypothetical protein
MCDSHESGVIMQLAGKRDALMPPNPEELLNRRQIRGTSRNPFILAQTLAQ